MKKVAMIPARMGSKRVPNKNLRMIDGKPLIGFILEAVIASGKFEKEDIYVNSESDVFKCLAEMYGVRFYSRPARLASDSATNDDFALDFIENVDCDTLFQFLATSPFLKPETIGAFVDAYKEDEDELSALISVSPVQIECVTANGRAINFDDKGKTPRSQDLTPVHAFACGMMAWDCDIFKRSMHFRGAAYHAPMGERSYFPVDGIEALDIDTEEDFKIAEAVYQAQNQRFEVEPQYWEPDKHDNIHHEVHVPTILKKDGVSEGRFGAPNQTIVNLRSITASLGQHGSWIHRVIDSPSNSACLIHQQPGEGNRKHYHPSWDEWWHIIQGDWTFEIANVTHAVQKGDFIFIPRNVWHKITVRGEQPGIRLAVSRADVIHSYEK